MSRGFLPRRLPVQLVRVGRRFPRLILAGSILACVIAAVLGSRVQVETDILSLVPENNQIVQDFKTTVERFGSVDTLLVVVRVPAEADMDGVVAFADQFANTLRDWDLVQWVEYRLEDPLDAALPLLDRATLFHEPEEIDALLERLTPEGLANQAQSIRGQLMAPQSVATKDLLRRDPIGLLPRLLDRVRVGGVGVRVDPETGCLLDEAKLRLLMLVKPIAPAQDIQFNKMLADGLSDRVSEATDEWRKLGWDGAAPRVEFTGGYIIALNDSQLIVSDLVVGLVSSLVGVMLLFLLAFRRRATLLFAFLPLVTGLGLTFIFIAVAFGRLNSLTSAFAGLLIGLGIDFIIVLYGRYVEERESGTTHEDAIDALGRHTGVGVLLGAVTTGATFYSFVVTDFRGLSELGVLTGTGILLLVATVFLLLPAMLTLLKKRYGKHRKLYLHSFGSDLVCRFAMQRPKATLVATGLATLAFGAAITQLEFDDDIRNMRSADNRGIILQQEVMDAFGLRFSPMTVRVDGKNQDEAITFARAILPELESLVDGENLASVDTIAGLMPDLQSQRIVIDKLAEAQLVPNQIADELRVALRSAGLNPAGFEQGIEHLIHALEVREPLRISDLQGTVLERVVDRYLVRHEDGFSAAIYCYPPAGKWRRDAPPELAQLVSGRPEAILAGPNVVSAELRRIVWGDAAKAAVLGLVLVFLMLWADLGTPLRSLLSLVPLVVGMVWMLGAMALLGIQVNLMNIFVLTMIIGIGVDYGVHLLHRWMESDGDVAALSETAKAIAVAAMTTMVGFGSLVLSHYPGLRSVGAAAILGAIFTALLSITLLPVLLMKLGMSNNRRGRDDRQAQH
ncbi:MAG: MMPL family transporter [bacterium]|nr:MMPL family transporter [bacterium]